MEGVKELRRTKLWIEDVAISFCFSVILGLFAPCVLFLPFSVIPIALQPHVAMLFSCLLGQKRACMMVTFFLLQGCLGYPVFGGGGFGVAHFLGPTGGYLIGYLVAANFLGSKKDFQKLIDSRSIFINLLIGNIIIYALGFVWLASYLGVSRAFYMGVLPFIITDMVKNMVLVKILENALFHKGFH